MENFVLNLFSDQLSKVILNFNDAKMKINANFMAGKVKAVGWTCRTRKLSFGSSDTT